MHFVQGSNIVSNNVMGNQMRVAEYSMEKINWLDNKLDGNNKEITMLFIIIVVIQLLASLSFS